MTENATTYPKTEGVTRRQSRIADVVTLAKVRVNSLVVATAAAGYYMAGPVEAGVTLLVITCVATALVAGGAAALNQAFEGATDRLMVRTRQRPVADGRMSATTAVLVGLLLAGAGLGLLAAGATASAAWVALATLLSYALVYTPLKRVTSLSTVVGAVPGALPPLIGWAAVRGSVSGVEPWSLFLIMFVWQLPHFLAIAWIYREDYARAGLPMLSVVDPHGAFTGRQTVLWAAALVPATQLPYLFGLATSMYAVSAIALSLAQLVTAVRFARHRSIANARTLFYASILYLPLLWGLMVLGRAG